MRRMLSQFARRDAHPVVQFIKYGLCGGVATVVDAGVFYALAWKVWPALQADDPVVRWMGLEGPFIADKALRLQHFLADRGAAFVVANFVVYVLNALWVFQPGRHARHVEIALFYAVSLLSVGSGLAVGAALIQFGDFSTSISYLANMVTCLLINFAGRKFIVFKG